MVVFRRFVEFAVTLACVVDKTIVTSTVTLSTTVGKLVGTLDGVNVDTVGEYVVGNAPGVLDKVGAGVSIAVGTTSARFECPTSTIFVHAFEKDS